MAPPRKHDTDRRSAPSAHTVAIRPALPGEAAALEALQRRASDVWDEYRDQLTAQPDAIALPQRFIDNGWVRVAVNGADEPLGFTVVVPGVEEVHELDGLFVDPEVMARGIGRALVQDACERALGDGAARVEVIAGPAQGFYEKLGFEVLSAAQTRFGPAVRMRRTL